MAGVTPAELFDVLERCIAEARTTRRWWHGRHRAVAWFTTPTVRIDGHEWYAVHHDAPHRRYGYTLPQAQAMRAALLPVLAAYHPLLQDVVRRLQPDHTLEERP